jgi:hypothetical protein
MTDTDAPHVETGAHVRRDSRGRRIGHNWWREYNCQLLNEAETAWQVLKESGEAIMTTAVAGADFQTGYYQLSEAEYRKIRPRPTLKGFLLANKGIGTAPASINGHEGESPWGL